MGASATPRTGDAVAVAFSGGLDSTALLHATARASAGARRIVACHVHHGLQPQADAWAAHCEQVAHEFGVGFACTRLSGAPARGDSAEAWARAGRHRALHEMAVAAGADLLLLAHHRRDQAETFLLQALRGAGSAGLAAMPAAQWREGLCWARPWLAQPREAIRAYAALHGLRWIEDPSNDDPRHARNRLRQTLWPAFASAEAGLAQAARWAQQADALAAEVVAQDLAGRATPERLDMAALAALSPARASNALRAWLSAHMSAPASLVQRLLAEWRPGATQCWPAPGGELHAWRDGLFWVPPATAAAAAPLDLSRPGRYPQPGWRGAWLVEPASPGIAPARLTSLSQRPRAGAEQFQRAPASVPRSLKKACQDAGLPPWRRGGPLLFDAGQHLVAVAGLGLDARAFAAPGEPALGLRWLDESADSALPQSEGGGEGDA